MRGELSQPVRFPRQLSERGFYIAISALLLVAGALVAVSLDLIRVW